VRTLPLVVGLVGAALMLPVPAAGAATCKPPTTLLTRTPVVRTLPHGVVMRTWDTGATSDPLKSQRVVAVRIPRSSTAGGRVMTNGSLNRSTTVRAYASWHSSVVTVNGSVFDPARGALPVGGVVQNKVPVKLSTAESDVVAFGTDRRASIDYVFLTGSTKARGYSWRVTGLNWQSVTGSGINVYTPRWGSVARPYGTLDVVVANGKVVARRTGTARGAAPKPGQVVLTATGTTGSQLSALRVGDAVSLSYGIRTRSGRTIVDAIQRGRRYLDDGVMNGGDCDSRSEQVRPRTAVGWTSGGDTLVVTVSGRAVVDGTLWGGATHHQMPYYLKQLGAVEAVSLDGGGSTTMLVRSSLAGSPYRVDRPTSYQRAVPTALSWW